MKTLRPTPSYEIVLPDDVQEDYEERVASFWKTRSPVLLQVSSYPRTEGTQVSAAERLRQRMEQTPGEWEAFEVPQTKFSDVAGASTTDDQGDCWIHVYMTNPHLAIYATISGPSGRLKLENLWAIEALRSIQPYQP